MDSVEVTHKKPEKIVDRVRWIIKIDYWVTVYLINP